MMPILTRPASNPSVGPQGEKQMKSRNPDHPRPPVSGTKSPGIRVAALLDHPRGFESLIRAIRGQGGFRWKEDLGCADSWEILHAWAEDGSFDLAVVDPYFGTGKASPGANLLALERLGSSKGRHSVVLYLCPRAKGVVLTPGVGVGWFPFVLTLGVDDSPSEICRVMARARSGAVVRAFRDGLRSEVEREGLDLLTWTVVGWPPVQRVGRLALQEKLSLPALRKGLARAGLPGPKRLLNWGRLLEAATLWEMGMTTRNTLARSLCFPCGNSLAHFSRNLSGRPLGHFLRSGGVEAVVRAFLSDVALRKRA
jgi:hypothetical protein